VPHLHHQACNLQATAAALAGGLELSALQAHKGLPRARAAAWLGPLLPAAAWLELSGWLPAGSLWVALLVLCGAALAATVLARRARTSFHAPGGSACCWCSIRAVHASGR
jgi:hypothetical protein